MKFSFLILSLSFLIGSGSWAQTPARIGSKIFTEGYILAEILAVQLENNGFPVERMTGLGATGVTEEAMKSKKIDLIVDYTGSIRQAHFKNRTSMDFPELKAELEKIGFVISNPLGFNNTYALAVRADWAEKNQIKTFSDLKKMSQVRAAFTPEFTSRAENWPGLKARYGFQNFEVRELDHQLAYQAVFEGKADVVEAYSTDAKLKEFKLVSLKDDLTYFPDYQAVIMTHSDWLQKNPAAWKSLQTLEGRISESQMIDLNNQADVEKKSFHEIAVNFLGGEVKSSGTPAWIADVRQATWEHLLLVLIPSALAFLVGVPLAYWTYKNPGLHPLIGSVATLVQTIPALAFLSLLIPFFGIGTLPALIVLFLYALLPIFISSHQGFTSIPALTHLSCQTVGVRGLFKFRKIELPMASPSILAGLQTSLITTVASATLAALIGAGGYGKKIIAGLAVNDMNVILRGAVPAALMALLFQFGFWWIHKIRENRNL